MGIERIVRSFVGDPIRDGLRRLDFGDVGFGNAVRLVRERIERAERMANGDGALPAIVDAGDDVCAEAF